MIWAGNGRGELAYISPEWTDFTGQSVADALGWGWVSRVHPEDRDMLREIVLDATAGGLAFSTWHRLLREDDRPTWVLSGGNPAFAGPLRTLSGFIGSITEVGAAHAADMKASADLGPFYPPPPSPSTTVHTPIDLLADYTLLARAIADRSGELRIRSALDDTLRQIARRIAATTTADGGIPRDGAGRQDVH